MQPKQKVSLEPRICIHYAIVVSCLCQCFSAQSSRSPKRSTFLLSPSCLQGSPLFFKSVDCQGSPRTRLRNIGSPTVIRYGNKNSHRLWLCRNKDPHFESDYSPHCFVLHPENVKNVQSLPLADSIFFSRLAARLLSKPHFAALKGGALKLHSPRTAEIFPNSTPFRRTRSIRV